MRRLAVPSTGIFLVTLSLLLAGCLLDGGYVSPSDKRNLRPMGQYVGTVAGGDPEALNRLVANARNPQLAVMWRSIGFRDDFTVGQSDIEASLPLTIRLSMLQPPPPKVVRAREITFGVLSLYMDVDGNGAFDRAMHPDFGPDYARLQVLTDRMDSLVNRLLEVSEIRPRTAVRETLYLDGRMDLAAMRGGRPDFLYRLRPGEYDTAAQLPRSIVSYPRLLGMQNRWERFFAQRKKDNEHERRSFPLPGWFRAIEIRYERAVWPKPGAADEFARRLSEALQGTNEQGKEFSSILADVAASSKLDYPFQGYKEEGQDWIAGRTLGDLLLYVPDSATLDTLRRAYPSSTFRIAGAERIRVGYNLFRCDDQYVCSVRARGDTLQMLAGSTEKYFNAPSLPYRDPFPKAAVQKPTLPDVVLTRMEGGYAMNGGDTLFFAVRNDQAWGRFPGQGLRRVLPVDSLGFHNPQSGLQGVFTAGLWGNPDRIIQYAGTSSRNSYVRVSATAPAWFLDRIDSLAHASAVDVADSILARYPGPYEYGSDTLEIRRAGGDSLEVLFKGLQGLVFHPVSDTLFQSAWGDWALEFPGCGPEKCRSFLFSTGAAKKVVPAAGDSPSNRLTSYPEPLEGPVWEAPQGGTGSDDFPSLDGLGRYACSRDHAFLRPGDGIVEEFIRGQPGDGISLRQSGDAILFRIEGMRGRRAVLELRACAEKDAKGKRVRISAWGGSEPGRLAPLAEGQGWLAISAAGSYWYVDSLEVDSDPYYLRLVEEDTRDEPVFNAFDGYRLGTRP